MSLTVSRAFASDLEVRSGGDGRTIHGIVVPFDRVAIVSDGGPAYEEAFQRGAFAKTIAERGDRVKLLLHHNRTANPLGRASLLREDSVGVYGEFRVSKTTAGDEAIELARDGAFDSFSVGFSPVKAEQRSSVTWRTEVALREVSLVTFPAYDGAIVGGVRMADLTTEDLAELARMLRENGAAATPLGEPAGTDTSPEAVHVEEPVVDHSARQAKTVFDFRTFCAERGL